MSNYSLIMLTRVLYVSVTSSISINNLVAPSINDVVRRIKEIIVTFYIANPKIHIYCALIYTRIQQ